MNGNQKSRRILFWLLGASLLLANATRSLSAEQTLPLLVTKTGTLTNATVTTKTETYVFVIHSAGMANIRVEDLSHEARVELGYVVEEEKNESGIPGAALAAGLVPKIEAQLEPLKQQILARVPIDPEKLKPTRTHLYIAGGVLVALFLFFSFCCHQIAIKSKKDPTPLAWIPVLQLIPLLRAAEMSGWWFLIAFIPIVPLVWCFKIAKARGMSVLVSIFLILPVTNLFAFLYLVFAREKPSNPVERYKSMSLQTA